MFFYVLLFFFPPLIIAQRNITIDDNNPAVQYTGTWSLSAETDLNAGRRHMLTDDPTAAATLTFTGTAVYFMSPRWPYRVTSLLQLDNQQPVLLDLQDHSRPDQGNGSETIASSVVWQTQNLLNTTHTLRITKGANEAYAIVDMIIYTILDSPTSSVPSQTPSTTSSISPDTSNSSSTSTRNIADATATSDTSSHTNALPIALGIVLGALGLSIITLAIWFCLRSRRKRPPSEAWTTASGATPLSQRPPTGPLSPNQTQNPHVLDPNSYNINNPSWSGPNAQISSPNDPVTNTTYYTDRNHPPQDFNPGFPGFIPSTQQVPYRMSDRYAPTSLSTITEKSMLGGSIGESKTPLGASPASLQSTELGFYTPLSDVISTRLSYASDKSVGGVGVAGGSGGTQQHNGSFAQSSYGQMRVQLESSNNNNTRSRLQGKGRGTGVVVNRIEEEGGRSKPPPGYF